MFGSPLITFGGSVEQQPRRDCLSRRVDEHPIIFDQLSMLHLLAGMKTQARVLATSPLRTCRPGDRLWVKETFVGGKVAADSDRELVAAARRADFVVFRDGWRQHRSGHGRSGPVPTSTKVEWQSAIHLPRWASRTTLRVRSVRVERLQRIRPEDVLADIPLHRLAGFYWRWPARPRGIWRDATRAFAATWNAVRGTRGERWEDDPEVVVLVFRVEGR